MRRWAAIFFFIFLAFFLFFVFLGLYKVRSITCWVDTCLICCCFRVAPGDSDSGERRSWKRGTLQNKGEGREVRESWQTGGFWRGIRKTNAKKLRRRKRKIIIVRGCVMIVLRCFYKLRKSYSEKVAALSVEARASQLHRIELGRKSLRPCKIRQIEIGKSPDSTTDNASFTAD